MLHQKSYSIKKKVIQYRSDAAVVHSSTFFTVPHRSQWISIRNHIQQVIIKYTSDVMIVNNLKLDQQLHMAGIMHWKDLLWCEFMILRMWVPVFYFKGVFLVDSVHVYNRTGFEDGVKLYRHAETTKHHVSVAVLGAECLVGDFKTRGAFDCAVDPGHLQIGKESLGSTNNQFRAFYQQIFHCICSYCDVVVVLRHIDKSRQTLAEPHGDLSVHVDSKGFKSFLKAAHGVVLEGASIFPQIHTTHLSQTETTHRNKP